MKQINKKLALVENCVFIRKSANVHVITIPSRILNRLKWADKDLVILQVSEDKKQLIVQKGKVVVA